ncbi:MAG: thioesterase family protein [Sedimentitalea sp.]
MDAPFVSSVMEVDPAWTDYNAHMNMAYYNVLFDRCADQVYEMFGFGPEYAARGFTTYTGEFHICYVRELHEGSKVRVSFQLIDHDEKRFHAYQEIRHEDGWLAATGEAMALHIDRSGPRVAPFPSDIKAKLEVMQAAHDVLGRPERVGRGIGITRRG